MKSGLMGAALSPEFTTLQRHFCTIVENGRRLGVNPKEYLTEVLTRLPAMKASEAASLIPANWLKARSANWFV